MSKDKPEVGDVWVAKDGYSRLVFICVNDYYYEYIEHYTKLIESFDIYRVNDIKDQSWKAGYKYLGKSKANLSDLFNVRRENDA